jgi:hypothetical protein
MAVWATASDVATVTGKTVSAENVAAAISSISVEVARTTDDVLATRDLYWLKQACCWQAAWLPDQPDFTGRSEVSNVSQDGVAVTYTDRASVVLAPLAKAAIRNLSWMKSRSVRPRNPFLDGSLPLGDNPLAEASDELEGWVAMR